MKTKYKYITYRKDKDLYTVSMRINGKLMQKTCHDIHEALRMREQMLRLRGAGEQSRMSRSDRAKSLNFENAYMTYLQDEVEGSVKPATYVRYVIAGKQYNRFFGKTRIDKITHEMWQDVFANRQEEGGLCYDHVASEYRKFRAMYAYFIQKKVITENPLQERVKLKKTEKRKRRAFTDEEEKRFLAAAKELDYKFFFLFAMYFLTGCRRGELVALQWKDVDFVRGVFHIRHGIGYGLVNGKQGEIYGTTKTKTSERDIPIHPQALTLLKAKHDAIKAKGDWFVFCAEGHPEKWLPLTTVEKMFRKIAELAGISDELTLHSIRHTVCTRLVLRGVDLATVQKIGGWATPKVPLSIYAHSTNEAVEKAMRSAIFVKQSV